MAASASGYAVALHPLLNGLLPRLLLLILLILRLVCPNSPLSWTVRPAIFSCALLEFASRTSLIKSKMANPAAPVLCTRCRQTLPTSRLTIKVNLELASAVFNGP